MNFYLHIKSFLRQENTIEPLGACSPFSYEDNVKKTTNWLKNKILLSIAQKKELEMTPALEKEGQWNLPAPNQLQKFPKTMPKDLRRSREVPRTPRKGKWQSQWEQTLHTGVQDPQI
ncbi:hypothetical protein O181_104004 [Austropuccinia psidii MF-1]|uniref:Uncharacterized protein n=1 Tax=Austropuccinia psidii MF-1 TaxID=1389203 RepID=A0A9Q3PJR4_9BASI|nr:hypothetical protein [Austropuccinia psidii MF-1]